MHQDSGAVADPGIQEMSTVEYKSFTLVRPVEKMPGLQVGYQRQNKNDCTEKRGGSEQLPVPQAEEISEQGTKRLPVSG